MSLRSTIIATTAFLAYANGHITMEHPVPFSVDKIDSGPITASQYPCKWPLGYTVSTMNNMAVGEKQNIKFKGTAVHGGGSCQLSVTMDTEPTESSVFKVIKSIEGGCPGVDGTTNEYEFELPSSIPNGKATFVWTWYSKMSGSPEVYMNCAPIEVTGGASDQTAFKELPDMLVANIAKGCTTAQNFATKFPNPGETVQKGATNDQEPPTGSCGTTNSTPDEPSGSAGVEPPAIPTSPPSGQNPPTDTPTTPSPTQPSGDSPPPNTPTATPVVPSASPIAPPLGTGTLTTLVTVTAKPTPAQPIGTGSPTLPTTPSTPSSPSEGGSSDTCTTNGAIICNGTTKFGLCNAGKVVWQDVAAGTTCTNGVIAKRGYNGRIARPRLSSPVDV